MQVTMPTTPAPIRALIVDDEPLARERVRTFLLKEPDIEIAAECADGAEAVSAIERLKPQLVFLDVQMPRLNGFEVLEAVDPQEMPVVIFTTAHDAHAIRAFEVSAVDYLLKPFKEARFRASVEKARSFLRSATPRGVDTALSALLAQARGSSAGPRIAVKSPDRILFLRPQEVDYIEAAGNYLVLHVATERHIIRETMTSMESRLGNGFMRVNRSAIVNLNRVREVQPLAAGEYCVVLKTGAKLDMTCSLRDLQTRLESV